MLELPLTIIAWSLAILLMPVTALSIIAFFVYLFKGTEK